jgi:hypothetical protein
MRIITPLQTLSAAAAIMLLAACSGGGPSAFAPKPASPQSGAPFLAGRIPDVYNPFARLNITARNGHHIIGRYACPATGPVKYVSDAANNVIDVFSGKFAGQAPCGQITTGVALPWGMYVKASTHDLYVANSGDFNILVFHRGQTTPYNTYTDPTGQVTIDVTVANDGTIIASNVTSQNGRQAGSLSTWIGGPNGGTFVGNFLMTNDIVGYTVTVQKDGTIYYNDIDNTIHRGVLWSLKCPAGACGAQSQVAGVSFAFPGGMGSDDAEDLLAIDQTAATADTFELPNPSPSTFPLAGNPVFMAINELDHHLFVTDTLNHDTAEYSYPGGKLIGTVPGNPNGNPIGVAIDPGHAR